MDEQKISFQVVEMGPVWLVGPKTTVQQGKTAAKFVKAFRENGDNAYLQALEGRVSPKGDIMIWMGEYDGASRSFTEIPGVFVKPGTPLREDLDVREIPRLSMGICLITGATRNLSRGAHNKLIKEMTKAGYVPDYSPGFSMEYYSYELYEKESETYTFAYMLPCRRA